LLFCPSLKILDFAHLEKRGKTAGNIISLSLFYPSSLEYES